MSDSPQSRSRGAMTRDADSSNPEVVVIGAGPAGLTAAYELSKNGVTSRILDRDEDYVGGIARTVDYKGFRFDIGGHRFFTKIKEVEDIWHEILSDEFLQRPRLSRIFYKNKFFHYPLRPVEALRKVGLIDTTKVVASYLYAQLRPTKEEDNFEQWVRNRFGHKLYSMFFKTYTEKVWGMPCTELGADWAAQRIKNLSLASAAKNALFGKKGDRSITTLIDQFDYPRLGPGQMWERCRDIVMDRGHEVLMGHRAHKIRHRHGKIEAVVSQRSDGSLEEIPASHVISSMPLSEVIQCLDPLPPDEVVAAAKALRYRDFLTVSLVVDREDLFPDNWIYVHSPDVQLGRIQNFKNWSPHMVPDSSKTCLGLEYFVFEGKGLWSQSNDELLALGSKEIDTLGLAQAKEVSDGTVVRMPKAYPVYDGVFQQSVDTIRAWLDQSLPDLHQIGRNGQHRYNNQDHSMMTALYAARSVMGDPHDCWNVNVEAEYHETMERQQPRRVGSKPEDAIVTT
ncbi:MAG: NAD(P)/FAD-dependent oxidoreductase [Planctomycetota bacterium]